MTHFKYTFIFPEVKYPFKSLNAQQKTHMTLLRGHDWIARITSGPIASHSISNVGLVVLKCLR